MSARLLISGYFGEGNLGDDAMLLGFVHGIGKLPVDLAVLSGSPEETHRNYGLRSVPRKDMGSVQQAIENCDALVFAGGSIFQDVTSVKSVAYYSHLIKSAKKAGKKVVLLGQGIGPLTTFFGKKFAIGALNQCDAIAVRDPQSAAALRSLGIKVQARAAGDLAWLLPKPIGGEDVSSFQVGDMRTVGLAPRPFGKDKDTVQLFGSLCRVLFESKFMPVLIEMDRELDGPLLNEIEKSQGGKVPSIRRVSTVPQLQQRMSRMDSVIAMRLHAGILAAGVGVPSLMISYDPKVNAFAQVAELPAMNVQGLTSQRLFENFMTFQKARDRHIKTLERKLEELQKMAAENIRVLVEAVPGLQRSATAV
ncbi:MAG: hypothetical protein HONBIEJF_02208 [Fimbriimonadaceae bacterium]|nr:hypothetical protein [Fimbriimonadaceae bacterium]